MLTAAGRNPRTAGFALLDVLALVGTGAVFALIMAAWLAILGRKSDGIVCLANQRQMTRAFAMYAESHAGLLPPNEDDISAQGHNWFYRDARNLPYATNQALASDPKVNLLAPYAPKSSIWKCPADPATVLAGGRRVRTIRSVSLNGAVGTACPTFPAAHSGAPLLATHGPWLDGAHGHLRGRIFRTFGQVGDFIAPAGTFVFVDEYYNTINDGHFGQPGYDPVQPALSARRWVDYPADYHGQAAGISFADGHAEIRTWIGLRFPRNSLSLPVMTPQNQMDWEWLGARASQSLR